MFNKQKRVNNLETFRDITDDVDESEFSPFACLYNENTIITKNGELLQTIKITGFNYENISNDNVDLRSTIRRAIHGNIPSDNYALWFHTMRKKVDLSIKSEYEDIFANRLNEFWNVKNNLKYKYVNEVYVTIVRAGEDTPLFNPKQIILGLIPKREIKKRSLYIENIYNELEEVSNNMLKTLESFGAAKLGLYKKDNKYYSQHLEFLEKLTNLAVRPMEVNKQDLSDYLTSGEITFGHTSMEVRTIENKRRFGAMLTVKEYKESSLPHIDKFLLIPVDFIITQCVDFINPEIALEQYREQKYYNDLSEDEAFSSSSELNDILNADNQKSIDFGQQQLSIFMLSDSIAELENNVCEAIRILKSYGIIVIREDLRLEECYWAQLPANFEFIRRLQPTSTMRVGGFSNLHNFPAGIRDNNHWNDAVSVFHTAAGTPYFFNFHSKNSTNGHSIIIGPYGSGKTVLLNFLITQATKFKPDIYYFDVTKSSYSFIEKICGKSIDEISINPFSLFEKGDDFDEDYIKFLNRWFMIIARIEGEELLTNENFKNKTKEAIKKTIEYILRLPNNEQNFVNFMVYIEDKFPDISNIFSPFMQNGEFEDFLTQDSDILNGGNIFSFNIEAILHINPYLRIAIISWLLAKVTNEIKSNDNPAIIILDEAWIILENTHITADISSWLNELKDNNAIVIFTTENIIDVANNAITPQILQNIATEIYLPDDDPMMEYVNIFGLSEIEFAYLDAMNLEDRHFLLKQNGISIVAELNLSGSDDIIETLSAGG